MDGVVTRDGDGADAVRHDNVFALPDDGKASLFQRGNGAQVVNAG